MSGAWSTRANALTLLRLLAAPALVVAVSSEYAPQTCARMVPARYSEVGARGHVRRLRAILANPPAPPSDQLAALSRRVRSRSGFEPSAPPSLVRLRL